MFTQMFSAFSSAILPRPDAPPSFSATGRMHFALVYLLIQKWRQAGGARRLRAHLFRQSRGPGRRSVTLCVN